VNQIQHQYRYNASLIYHLLHRQSIFEPFTKHALFIPVLEILFDMLEHIREDLPDDITGSTTPDELRKQIEIKLSLTSRKYENVPVISFAYEETQETSEFFWEIFE
jgi:hypothetical protein